MPYGEYLYGATAFILLLEIIMGRHKGIYNRHTLLVTGGCIIAAATTRPLAAIFIAHVISFLIPYYENALANASHSLSFLSVFFLAEFSFYWVHRWAHEAQGWRNSWLWKFHRTHHSAKFMNVGVTIRQNAFWPFVVPTPWVLGVATYLGLEPAAAATIVVIYGWNLLTHSHFRWDDAIRRNSIAGPAFRALEHIFVSPGIHHTHHGYGKDGANYRNFAVTLSLLDWIFGTLHIPNGRPARYGLPGPETSWKEEVLYPLIRAKAVNR